MMKIATLNKIADCGLDILKKADFAVTDDIADAAGVLVRSAAMHEMELPESLLAIGRAGAGVNNIPIDRCSEQGVVVFNTPGANANAVKELVVCGLFLASRKVMPAIDWAKTLKGNGDAVGKMVEKGKGAFAGPEIAGKKLGVIGLGAIGILVANAATHLGMEVYGYDPYLSVDAAWKLSRSVTHAADMAEIFAECDYITIHVPLNDGTRGFINSQTIDQMKDGVRILNFARGELVNSADLIDALGSGKVAAYVTDFPSDEVIGVEGVVAIPHLGASTQESEDNCAVMAAQELVDYILNGNIRNSVNLPNVQVARSTAARICVIHRNIPNMLAQISSVVSAENINIEKMNSESKKDYAYTILDVATDVTDEALAAINAVDGVIRVRVIK